MRRRRRVATAYREGSCYMTLSIPSSRKSPRFTRSALAASSAPTTPSPPVRLRRAQKTRAAARGASSRSMSIAKKPQGPPRAGMAAALQTAHGKRHRRPAPEGDVDQSPETHRAQPVRLPGTSRGEDISAVPLAELSPGASGGIDTEAIATVPKATHQAMARHCPWHPPAAFCTRAAVTMGSDSPIQSPPRELGSGGSKPVLLAQQNPRLQRMIRLRL